MLENNIVCCFSSQCPQGVVKNVRLTACLIAPKEIRYVGTLCASTLVISIDFHDEN